MNAQVDQWILEHREDIVNDLRGCIAVKSLKSEAKDGAPFGDKIKECLDYTLGVARNLGFEAADHQGYFGCIDYGQGDETLGILAHLDIVPEGTGWDMDPYNAPVVDGKIYGRGTLDDKGPAIASLYALKAVDECGVHLKRKVRIILGCDEESGMECMKYYKESQPLPDLSISPDGEYPLTNSEKSIAHAVFEKKFVSGITLEAGEVANVVPGEAVAIVTIPMETVQPIAQRFAQTSPCGIVITSKGESSQIKILGTLCHASMPEDGLNAIQGMLAFLKLLPLDPRDSEVIHAMEESFKMEYYGQSIGLDKADDSGRLTLNLGVIRWDENGFALTFDLRCPTSLPEGEIKEALCRAMEKTGAELKSFMYKAGYFLPDDSEIVTKLLKVFKLRTGEELPPKKIGGGTYARTLPNAVSFGPEGYMCESSAHMANEFIGVEQLMFNTKILADAIISLAGAE